MVKNVIFSNRAISSLLSETLEKIHTETGGVFLGYRYQDVWYIVESIDPGPKSVFRTSYFEYDQNYVNHLINKISRIYRVQLDLIGLWHRHPGSIDRFSSTDDITNEKYAVLNKEGAISVLVNIDPDVRLSVFHVTASPLKYTKAEYCIGDNHFPRELLRYADRSSLLNEANAVYADDSSCNSNRIANKLHDQNQGIQQAPFSFNQALQLYLAKQPYYPINSGDALDQIKDIDAYITRILCVIQEDMDYLSSIGIELKLSYENSGYIEMTEIISEGCKNDYSPVVVTYIIINDIIMMQYGQQSYEYHSGLLREAHVEMAIAGGSV